MDSLENRFLKLNELQLDVLYLVWFFNIFDNIINTIFTEEITIQNKIDFDWEYIYLYNRINFYISKNEGFSELNKLFEDLFWELKSLSNLNNYIENYLWWVYDILNNEYWELVSEIRNLRYKYNVDLKFDEIVELTSNFELLKKDYTSNINYDFIDEVNDWIIEFRKFIEFKENLYNKLEIYYSEIIQKKNNLLWINLDYDFFILNWNELNFRWKKQDLAWIPFKTLNFFINIKKDIICDHYEFESNVVIDNDFESKKLNNAVKKTNSFIKNNFWLKTFLSNKDWKIFINYKDYIKRTI